MTNHSSSPVAFLAIAIFAVTGLFASNPVSGLVDCSDSFWEVACGEAGQTVIVPADAETPATSSANLLAETNDEAVDEAVEETRRIDDDPTCTTLENGNLFCHS